jgi:Cu-Zn family superoxide dismutase
MKALTIPSTSVLAIIVATGIAAAQQLSFDINRISDTGVGEKIGTATVMEGKKSGVTFKMAVKGLPKGQRGFHVHEKGDCGPAMKQGKMTAGVAAGEHYDPDGAKSHKGPKGGGHKGDLPALTATARGINQTVHAPNLKLSDIAGRSLVIHEGGDNYSDQPENGGGKGRIACGIIPKRAASQ